MAYATVYQVAARNAARGTYSSSTIPSASQVIGFLEDSKAQLDTWLFNGGYDSPFDAAIASGHVATTAQILLRRWNVIGAALAVEESAQASDRLPEFQRMWEEVKKATCEVDLPLPMLSGKAFPRGLGMGRGTAVQQQFGFSQVMPGSTLGHWDL